MEGNQGLPQSQATRLLCLPRHPSQTDMQAWLDQTRPEVVIDAGNCFDWLQGRSIGYVTLNWSAEHPERSGTDQQAEVLGAAAMDLLVAQFQHNERGIPAHPRIVMTEGQWREGTTLRRIR